jgi:hypothetical protein
VSAHPFLQHATAVGFVLAGVLAGFGTADELATGAIADTLLREPRRQRLVAVKTLARLALLLTSALITTVGLYITGAASNTWGFL